MDPFKVLYYPNSECHPLTLARSILVFDELLFLDHPSLTFTGVGTVGHDSMMRQIVAPLQREGYQVKVIKPKDGPVEGELQNIINADLANGAFRETFFQLIKNDPSFLMTKVPNGDYGKYGDADNLRRKILSLAPTDVPSSVEEIKRFKVIDGMTPEIIIALTMAADSYMLNLSTYLAIDQEVHLFGDSRGMDMLLSAKLSEQAEKTSRQDDFSHKLAFTLLEHLIPTESFVGKDILDIARFRNKMTKEREKFKEHILEFTAGLSNLSVEEREFKLHEILHRYLLPEARGYQNKLADNWDKFFKGSSKAVLKDQGQITQVVVSVFSHSLATALLLGALRAGSQVLPHLIEYLKEKESINRKNPYTYLMKFK